MRFSGHDPVRIKIVVENKCLQQEKHFKYPGCEISYKNEKDIQHKLPKFSQIMGNINNNFKPTVVQKF